MLHICMYMHACMYKKNYVYICTKQSGAETGTHDIFFGIYVYIYAIKKLKKKYAQSMKSGA